MKDAELDTRGDAKVIYYNVEHNTYYLSANKNTFNINIVLTQAYYVTV